MAKTKKTKKQRKRVINREYRNIMLLFTGLFVLMTGYLIYFQVVKSRATINNSYNARLETFEHQVIRGNILSSDGQVLACTEVDAEGKERRVYPFDSAFAHVVGYSQFGKTGIEALGNFQLLTSSAPFMEKFIHELKGEKNRGDSLITTLDVTLQMAAYEALGNHKGAVIVMEPATGNVRALVSKPDFHPEQILSDWPTLSSSSDGVLLNRATQGLYPPGSVFKSVTLLAYLREHRLMADGYTYQCDGKVTVGDFSIRCYRGKQHGELDLKKAYAKSCNSAFAEIGTTLDVKEFRTLSKELLFDAELPLELPYSKSLFQLKESDTEAIRMMTAIGQAETLVTPMHMAMLTSAAANKGVLMVPRFLEQTENYLEDTIVERYPVTTYGPLFSVDEATVLKEYMRAVVEDGTASALQSERYTASGKTGTAEYSNDKSKSHAWFAGYAEGEKETLVVCVIVEGAGSGSEYAVPIAKRIFDTYYQ